MVLWVSLQMEGEDLRNLHCGFLLQIELRSGFLTPKSATISLGEKKGFRRLLEAYGAGLCKQNHQTPYKTLLQNIRALFTLSNHFKKVMLVRPVWRRLCCAPTGRGCMRCR